MSTRKTTTNKVQTQIKAYGEYAEAYDDGRKFLPLAVRLEMFRQTFPTGTIIVSTPERDAFAEGVTCRCSIYADAAKRDTTLLAESFARRVAAQVQDGEIDLFAAVRAAAVSSALSLAGIELPVEQMLPDGSSEDDVSDEASVVEAPKKKRVRSVKTRESEVTEELSPSGAPIPESVGEISPEENVAEESSVEPEETSVEPSSEEIVEETSEPVEEDAGAEVTEAVESEEVSSIDDSEDETEEPEVDVEEPADDDKAEETPSELDLLMQETGMSYDDAINYEFRHQTRKGVYGDLLADESSRALLVWFSKENGMFSRKNPEASKIARIIVLHDNLA